MAFGTYKEVVSARATDKAIQKSRTRWWNRNRIINLRFRRKHY
jgi:hypothetical protein